MNIYSGMSLEDFCRELVNEFKAPDNTTEIQGINMSLSSISSSLVNLIDKLDLVADKLLKNEVVAMLQEQNAKLLLEREQLREKLEGKS